MSRKHTLDNILDLLQLPVLHSTWTEIVLIIRKLIPKPVVRNGLIDLRAVDNGVLRARERFEACMLRASAGKERLSLATAV